MISQLSLIWSLSVTEDLHHRRPVTNSNGSFISPNSSTIGQKSKICSQALLFCRPLAWVEHGHYMTSLITESPKGGPLNDTCPYRLGGWLFSTRKETVQFSSTSHGLIARMSTDISHRVLSRTAQFHW